MGRRVIKNHPIQKAELGNLFLINNGSMARVRTISRGMKKPGFRNDTEWIIAGVINPFAQGMV